MSDLNYRKLVLITGYRSLIEELQKQRLIMHSFLGNIQTMHSICFGRVLFYTSHIKTLLSGLYSVGGAKARQRTFYICGFRQSSATDREYLLYSFYATPSY